MKETLGPRRRIRKKKEFDFIYKYGYRFKGRYFTLVYLENKAPFCRLGVVASRRVGGAVLRNKAKRRFRDLFRRNAALLARSLDMVIIARREAALAAWPDIRSDFLEALKKLAQKSDSA